MSSQKNQRRRWIVNPRYQLRFALGLVALNLSVGFVYQVALHYRMREMARRAADLEAFLDLDPWASIWPAMVVATFFSAIVVFYIGIRYSHQIVGPLPRYSRALREIARGENPPRLRARENDVLADLAAGINLVADTLQGSYQDPSGKVEPVSGFEGEVRVDEPVAAPDGSGAREPVTR